MDGVIGSAIKSAPPVSVTAAWIAGIDLPHVVMALTALYTALQIIFLIRDKCRCYKRYFDKE